jgi:hypothetical protein
LPELQGQAPAGQVEGLVERALPQQVLGHVVRGGALDLRLSTLARELDHLAHVIGAALDEPTRRPQPRAVREGDGEVEPIAVELAQRERVRELALRRLERGRVDEHEAEQQARHDLDLERPGGPGSRGHLVERGGRLVELLEPVETSRVRQRHAEGQDWRRLGNDGQPGTRALGGRA